jgi:hypothetical protein
VFFYRDGQGRRRIDARPLQFIDVTEFFLGEMMNIPAVLAADPVIGENLPFSGMVTLPAEAMISTHISLRHARITSLRTG